MFRVFIDQDLCTGDGLCVDACPDIFQIAQDGIAYVKEADWPTLYGPDGKEPGPVYQMGFGLAAVPERLEQAVIDAADICPGECIFIVPADLAEDAS